MICMRQNLTPSDGDAIPDDYVGRLVELQRLGQLPVWDLASPSLEPRFLAEAHFENHRVKSVTLACGDPSASNGPWIMITTTAGRGDPRRALVDERDRFFSHTGERLRDPTAPDRAVDTSITIDGVARSALVVFEEPLWSTVVSSLGDDEAWYLTVVGRDIDPSTVEFRIATDIGQHIHERTAILKRLADAKEERGTTHTSRVGLTAVRHLAGAVVARDEWVQAALAQRRSPSSHDRPSDDLGAAWEDATIAQSSLTGQNREEATETLTTFVTQFTYLAEHAPWFEREEIQRSVIDESLAYWVRGQRVASGDAHDRWKRIWQLRSPRASAVLGLDSSEDLDLDHLTLAELETEWINAWNTWAESKR